MKKQKICIVSDYAYPSGGIEIFIDEIILASREKVNYHLLTWQHSQGTQRRKEIVPTTRIDCGNFTQIWSELNNADIIFLQTSFNVRILASLTADYCLSKGKKLISVIHTSSNSHKKKDIFDLQQNIFEKVLRASNIVVGVSKAVKKSLLPIFEENGLDKTKLVKIANASRFKSDLKRCYKRRKTITFIGRPTKAKGIDVFVDLVEQLKETDIDFVINTVSMPLPSEFEFIRERATIINLLNEDEMEELFLKTDLLIVPYRYADGLPLTVLEALSYKIPIVGFKAKGVKKILKSNQQYLIDVDDITTLVKLIKKWIEGEVNLIVPQKTNIKTWDEQSKLYLKLFDKVISHGK